MDRRKCIRRTSQTTRVKFSAKVFYASGTGRLEIVNQVGYRDVTDSCLPPHLAWFLDDDCIFIHHGAHCHTTTNAITYLDNHSIKVLDWPGNSTDLNSIE